MIISASRRCDIPAMYSNWFINRLKAGYVYVPNPYNDNRYYRVDLRNSAVDIIVFWTKNPRQIMNRLKEIDKMGYKYYFQFTLTPYDKTIESKLPSKAKLLNTFIELSQLIGKNNVIWRYDPIIITDELNICYHEKMFEKFASLLGNYTNICYISFIDEYKNISRSMGIKTPYNTDKDYINKIANKFSQIAKLYNISLYTCAEYIDLSKYNIHHGSCINKEIIENILQCNIIAKKDKNQRKNCGCLESIEIGTYNSCNHGCKYCYANRSQQSMLANIRKHDENADVLIGTLPHNAIVTNRDNKSVVDYQINMFDIIKDKSINKKKFERNTNVYRIR